MFRTVVINEGEHIRIKENWLVVLEKETERRIPLEDIYCLVVDNQQATVTIPAITALTDAGSHVLICNRQHMPVSAIYGYNTHYRPLNVIRRQISLTQDIKDTLWDKVIQAKLINQACVLELRSASSEKSERIRQLSKEIKDGDSGNREGIAAKLYFRALFGTNFIRFNDDGINSALNYGYAIIRSAVAKTLVAYGFSCVLGIHHINENNPFNLADDLMEPFRPLVDMWVDENNEDLYDHLTKQQRLELIDLVNHIVLCDNKKMRVRNAVDKYIASFTNAIETGSPSKIKFPSILNYTAVDRDSDD
jgi:CRISPR-associated protein Cas1